MNELMERAVEYKHGGCNCSQAVIKALSEYYELDNELLLKVSAGFGVGMGTMEATCGSLIGANIIAGVLTNGQRTGIYSRELMTKFINKSGASVCKVLKGVETGKMLCPCDDCVRNAVSAALEVLGEK